MSNRSVHRVGFASFARRPNLAIVLLALAPLVPGHATAQEVATEAASNPLPIMVYPTARADKAPADAAPPPAPIAEAPPPVQYYLVNGVWGFWDRDHHFHPRPPAIVHGVTEDRHGSATLHAQDGGRRAEFPHADRGIQAVPHNTIRLSNPPPRAIVVQSPMPRGGNLTR